MYLYTVNNILSYNHNGMKNNGTFGLIDDLTISYDGNHLLKVTDDAEALNYNGALDFDDGDDSTCEYDYDDNGALTRDSNRGINSITYDYSHHPSLISRTTKKKTIYYDYTPDDRKLSSTHISYIPNGNSNIRILTRDLYVDGLILRGDTALLWRFGGGYVELNANGTPTSWNYYVTDHLGSTRMVVDSNDNIRETINYYPFGSEMRMENPALLTGGTSHPFRFTGKEFDKMHGLNTYDYGARHYNPVTARWDRVDPLCEKYYSMSPYNYCGGNPINAIDPNGCDWISAKYGDELFVYYDSRIKNKDDIVKVYYDDEYRDYYDIQYVGETGSVYGYMGEEKITLYTLNSNGSYNDSFGNEITSEISIEGLLHIGNSKMLSSNYKFGDNYYGIYLGSENPYSDDNDFYAIPPIDRLDYSAFIHDKAYDMFNARGKLDALLNRSVANADYQLSKRALNDAMNSKIGTERWKWGLRAGLLFGLIAVDKYITIPRGLLYGIIH